MRLNKNNTIPTTGSMTLSMLGGWTPAHRSLEAGAAEMADMAERDTAACVAFQCLREAAIIADQLSFDLIITDPQAAAAEAARKPRKGLSCSKSFASAGPGNRICTRCKGTETFTCSPSAFTVHASF